MPAMPADPDPQPSPATRARQHWMSVLARARPAAIDRLLAGHPALPAHQRLRGPESGLVMVQGRAGGGGAPFHLGEVTVTRCSVRNAAGAVGHATVLGRDARQAELAAALDAALQMPSLAEALQRTVIAPLARAQATLREEDDARAAATRVQFFTLATMRS